MSKVVIVKSKYLDIKADPKQTDIVDVPDAFYEAKRPLYISAIQGQKMRVDNVINIIRTFTRMQPTAIGFWELPKSNYIKDGSLNLDEFRKHDYIYIADNSHRLKPEIQKLFDEMVLVLCSQLR